MLFCLKGKKIRYVGGGSCVPFIVYFLGMFPKKKLQKKKTTKEQQRIYEEKKNRFHPQRVLSKYYGDSREMPILW